MDVKTAFLNAEMELEEDENQIVAATHPCGTELLPEDGCLCPSQGGVWFEEVTKVVGEAP